ncbi:YesN/AraC family two-component response regulator [Paenibacillus sp. DS2015]|uniref:response regulator transcription factor n=1 Tax=Paenibacillus sp. DS2015 TaxID=3373917 RepID=UPI003D22A623
MRIMIVDDEPIFLYHLKETIQSCCEALNCAFDFVSECYSAEKAIMNIPEVLPDIIFTDIRMNAMDGIELAQKVREEWPHIKVIIVSGYPSFDYARSAMRANVVDYLIKPIESEAVLKVLTQTLGHMNANLYQRKGVLLQTLIEKGGMSSGHNGLDPNLLSSNPYGVIAVNSSEFQFNPLLYDAHMGMQSVCCESIRPMLLEGEEVWLFPNANKKGLLFIFTLREYQLSKMKSIGEYLLDRYSTQQSFAITAISPQLKEVSELREEVRRLSRNLDHHQVIGLNILLLPEDREMENNKEYTSLSDIQGKTLNYLSKKNDWHGIREAILQLFEVWRMESCPSVYIEMNLRKVVDAMGQLSDYQDPLIRREMEQSIQDLLFASADFNEVGDVFVDWLQSIVKPSSQPSEKKGKALFHRIQQYIMANLGQPLNLLVLTEEFKVSSTYLCNLFRIYCGGSFVEYFTDLRINKAKALLHDHPEIPIKDISEIVGYIDRHYFSKVFKSSTGLTPSEFRNQIAHPSSI